MRGRVGLRLALVALVLLAASERWAARASHAVNDLEVADHQAKIFYDIEQASASPFADLRSSIGATRSSTSDV